MVKVFVYLDGKVEFTEILPATHQALREGSSFRGHPIHFYLRQVVKEYGSLTEKNILRFMQEKWI